MFKGLSGKGYLRNLSNIPGWRTRRKFVVFESDDWGSIRMPSKEVFENLLEAGIDLIGDSGFRFNKYDTLATSEDLALLFDVLASMKDYKGRSAVFTPVSVTANPDFKKICQNDFKEYFYEPFTETLKRSLGCENSYDLWKEGIDKRLFMPQFHGREHLNVKVWMKALQENHKKTRVSFDNKMWGISTADNPEIKVEFQAAFDFIDKDDLEYQKEVIISGLNLFHTLFNYRATYFVPPNGPYSSTIEPVCFQEGVKIISVSKLQIEPLGSGMTRKKVNWMGKKSKSGVRYITRNCLFEPFKQGKDWVDSCLHDISVAFRWHKPAVISSHRVNYVGTLDKQNRDRGLKQLKMLLTQILKNWPDAEFITSAELGEIICNDK